MPDPINDARILLRTRLAELQAEMKQVEQALKSLDGRRRGPGRPRGRRTRKTSRPRAGRGERQQAFLKAVEQNPGVPTRQLAEKVGVSANQAHGLARKLRDDKMIRKSGKGYAVTRASSGSSSRQAPRSAK